MQDEFGRKERDYKFEVVLITFAQRQCNLNSTFLLGVKIFWNKTKSICWIQLAIGVKINPKVLMNTRKVFAEFKEQTATTNKWNKQTNTLINSTDITDKQTNKYSNSITMHQFHATVCNAHVPVLVFVKVNVEPCSNDPSIYVFYFYHKTGDCVRLMIPRKWSKQSPKTSPLIEIIEQWLGHFHFRGYWC